MHSFAFCKIKKKEWIVLLVTRIDTEQVSTELQLQPK